jgi:RNA polymerase sigma-70 factor (ECF subfamily)
MVPSSGHDEERGGASPAPAVPSEPSRDPFQKPEFERVFADEAAYVGRTLRYLGVHDAHVEDLAQEVFLVVHRRLSEFTGGSMRAWVRQICVHTANNYRRSVRRRPEDAVAEPDSEIAAPQHEDAEVAQLQRRLLAALSQLPEEQRTIFVLFEIEGLTMSETAEAAGCPLQTAYSRLYSARTKLQEALTGASKEQP